MALRLPGGSKGCGGGRSLQRLREGSNATPGAGHRQEHRVVHAAAFTTGEEHQSISENRLPPRDPD